MTPPVGDRRRGLAVASPQSCGGSSTAIDDRGARCTSGGQCQRQKSCAYPVSRGVDLPSIGVQSLFLKPFFVFAPQNMSASPDLLWALTRKTNSFLKKRNGLFLTSEPNNVAAKHSFKFSGLANAECIGVGENAAERGKPPPRTYTPALVSLVPIKLSAMWGRKWNEAND